MLPRKTSAALELMPELGDNGTRRPLLDDHLTAETCLAMLEKHSPVAVGYCSKGAQALEDLAMQCLD